MTTQDVALIIDNGKVLAQDGSTVQQVTSWEQAQEIAGDRGLIYDDANAIEAVLGPRGQSA